MNEVSESRKRLARVAIVVVVDVVGILDYCQQVAFERAAPRRHRPGSTGLVMRTIGSSQAPACVYPLPDRSWSAGSRKLRAGPAYPSDVASAYPCAAARPRAVPTEEHARQRMIFPVRKGFGRDPGDRARPRPIHSWSRTSSAGARTPCRRSRLPKSPRRERQRRNAPRQKQRGHRHCPIHQGVADPAAERLRYRHRPRTVGENGHHQDRERCQLDPAGGRSGRSADHHDTDRHEQGCRMGIGERRRSRIQRFASRCSGTSRPAAWSRPEKPDSDVAHSRRRNQARLPAGARALVTRTSFTSSVRGRQRRFGPHVVKGDVRQRPGLDQQHHRDIDPRRIGIRRQRLEAAVQVESSVAKGRDRHEGGVPQRRLAMSRRGPGEGERSRR